MESQDDDDTTPEAPKGPPSILYHRSPALLRKGDTIPPGNWGRMVLGIGGNHQFFFREYLFERVRAAEFPARPARLDVAYAFESAAYAQSFRSNAPLEHVYVVRPADPACLSHRADMAWMDVIVQYRTFEGAEGCARRYWQGDERAPDGQSIEWLFAGPLVVVDRITPLENGVH